MYSLHDYMFLRREEWNWWLYQSQFLYQWPVRNFCVKVTVSDLSVAPVYNKSRTCSDEKVRGEESLIPVSNTLCNLVKKGSEFENGAFVN